MDESNFWTIFSLRGLLRPTDKALVGSSQDLSKFLSGRASSDLFRYSVKYQ